MRAEDVVKRWTTPLAAPAYPEGRYRFTDREYLDITYRTDPGALTPSSSSAAPCRRRCGTPYAGS
ncbi:hypothetical protein [Streptomyces sp. NPDC002520]